MFVLAKCKPRYGTILPKRVKKMTRLALILAVIFVLAGCATGSALVTGQIRTAIEDHSTIQILTSMPAGAEETPITLAMKLK